MAKSPTLVKPSLGAKIDDEKTCDVPRHNKFYIAYGVRARARAVSHITANAARHAPANRYLAAATAAHADAATRAVVDALHAPDYAFASWDARAASCSPGFERASAHQRYGRALALAQYEQNPRAHYRSAAPAQVASCADCDDRSVLTIYDYQSVRDY